MHQTQGGTQIARQAVLLYCLEFPICVCLCVSLCVCQPACLTACQTVSLPVWCVSLSVWSYPLWGDDSVHAIHTSQEKTGKRIKAAHREVNVQNPVPELSLQ